MSQSDNKTTVRIVTLIASCVIVLGTYFFIMTPKAEKKKFGEQTNEVVPIGGDFTLTNTEGLLESTKKFSSQYKIVYFGFTYCPDICPMALSTISEAINITDKYGIDIVPIFITVDPSRDTKEVLGPYLAHFNKKFVGYTGSEEEIKNVADLFKVYYAKVPRTEEAGGYTEKEYLMDHSSFIYLISPGGKYVKHFSSSTTSEEIAKAIHQEVKAVR